MIKLRIVMLSLIALTLVVILSETYRTSKHLNAALVNLFIRSNSSAALLLGLMAALVLLTIVFELVIVCW